MQIRPDPLSIETSAFWLQMGTAILCGGAIGIERQLRGKAAGIRTSILVCVGTSFFVGLGNSFPIAHSDPTRALGQVITGIGFLGAGVILAKGDTIIGVTSAATIWMLAAIGSLIGFGRLATAMVVSLATLAILIGVELLESGWAKLKHGNVNRKLDMLELEK